LLSGYIYFGFALAKPPAGLFLRVARSWFQPFYLRTRLPIGLV
jgi:hypothetical protein